MLYVVNAHIPTLAVTPGTASLYKSGYARAFQERRERGVISRPAQTLELKKGVLFRDIERPHSISLLSLYSIIFLYSIRHLDRFYIQSNIELIN